jgi:hypothetical protein
MKRILNTFFTIITIILMVTFTSCEDDNEPIFVAQENTEGIVFINAFAAQYLLSEETSNNIADRLIWTVPNYEVATNISYEIEGAIDADSNGLPNNLGVVYLRVKAFLGAAEPTNIKYSPIQAISISIIETVIPGQCDSLFALGDALVDHGWNFPGAELVCENDVLEVKVSLTQGNFRFFQIVNDWDSGLGFSYFLNEGYTIDSDLVDADDSDSNFNFVGTDGIYTLRIDNIVKEITLTPSTNLWAVGEAVPGGWGFNDETIELIETSPDIWSASIILNSGLFRLFPFFNDWNTSLNYPYYGDQGFSIDNAFEGQEGSDENFTFVGTPGTYILTIDAINQTITLN